jgi:hypothetical protein
MESANCRVTLAFARSNDEGPNISKFLQMSECKYYNIINYVGKIFVNVWDY